MEPDRMTPDEARAIVALWSQQRWERQAWPTVADVAEALEIPTDEAVALLAAVRRKPSSGGQGRRPLLGTDASDSDGEGGRLPPGEVFRLVSAALSLTGFFSLVLERLLA